MASEDAQLVVQLEARIRDFEKNMQKAARSANDNFGSIENRAKRSSRQLETTFGQAANSVNAKLNSIGKGFLENFNPGKIAAGMATALSVEQIRKYSDAWVSAQNKIKAAMGENASGAGVATDLVAGISERALSSFSETASLFASLTRASKDLHASEADVLVVTESVSKALTLGGASAEEASSAILQLGQALGSGVLQGDELHSLLENAPTLAASLAKAFNTTTAGLKQLGSDGALTSDKVFKALLDSAQDVNKQFKELQPTIAQAFNVLETKAIAYVGHSNAIKTATDLAGKAIIGLANNLDTVGTGAAALGSILAARLLAAGITPVIAGMGSLTASLTAAVAGITATGTAAGIASASLTIFSRALAVMGGPVGIAIAALGATFAYVASKISEGKPVADAYAKALDELKNSGDGTAQSLKNVGNAALEGATKMREATEATQGAHLKSFDADASSLTDTLRGLVQNLEQFGAFRINEETKAQALEIIKRGMDGDAQAANEAAKSIEAMGAVNPSFQDAFGKFDTLLARLAMVRQAAQNAHAAINEAKNAESQAKTAALDANQTGVKELAEANRLKTANDKLSQEQVRRSKLSSDAKAIEDRAKSLQTDFAKQGGKLSDTEAKTLATNLIGNEKSVSDSEKPAKTSHSSGKSEEEKQADAIKAQIKSLQEEARQEQAEAATLGKTDAEKRLALELSKNMVSATSAEGKAIADNVSKITSAQDAIKAYDKAQEDAKAQTDFFKNSLEGSLESLIVDGQSVGETFKNLAAEIERAALQAALLGEGPLANLFGSGSSKEGSGGILGALFSGGIGSLFKFADGGAVSGPGSSKSDSIPALLSNGEYVVSADATRRHRTLLDAINSGKVPRFASGGLVSAPSISAPSIKPASGAVSGASGGGMSVTNNVTVNASGGTKEQNNDLAKQVSSQIEAQMRQIAANEIRSQSRPGGYLAR
ncbi:tape measure protein [Beijerinckia mobilis]|uniref:tape measure protein n=1 Tax=Beijerinckia mobilis TaxID=231434 RepID=UPI00054E3FD5|nr:tape measure protein [Beijerinckia mobilis]